MDGFKDAIGISSPAKEFIKAMGFVGQGIVIGTDNQMSAVAKAGRRLGVALSSGFKPNLKAGVKAWGTAEGAAPGGYQNVATLHLTGDRDVVELIRKSTKKRGGNTQVVYGATG